MTRTATLTRKVAATVAALTVLIAVSPSLGRATDVPYHTKPTFTGASRYVSACQWNFHSPSVVLGFTDEYVAWQPVAAFYANGKWNYRYGDWKLAHTSPSRMIFGWMNPDLTFSNGDSGVSTPSGTTSWLGYQIVYGSNNYVYFEWLGGGATC